MENLLKNVTGLYVKFGIRSVTMDDVARELGISKKTLYKYVQDKEELVKKAMEYQFEKNKDCFHKIRSSGRNAIDELLEVSRFVTIHLKNNSPSLEYDLSKYYPAIYKELAQKKRELMYEMVLANIKRGKQEGLYRPGMDDEIITKLHVWRIEGMKDNPVFAVEDFSTGKIFRELFTYHIRGIANSKGIKFLEENIHKLDQIDLEHQEK